MVDSSWRLRRFFRLVYRSERRSTARIARSLRLGTGLLCLSIVFAAVGCEFELVDETGGTADSSTGDGSDGSTSDSAILPTASEPGETILIGSHNIQVFGQSKLENPDVMALLAEIAYRFDVLAIQEVRSKEQDVLPRFVELINRRGADFQFAIGPRLGRSNSKEQYAFVYDARRLELIGQPFTVPDPDDWLHREPMVARFRVRGLPPEEAFSFVLINIHTDPDETDTELDALADVYQYVQAALPDEDDFILLGDLNVDEHHLGRLGELPGISYVVAGQPTNTRGTKCYDNLIFHRVNTFEYTGRGGVFNITSEYGLTADEALRVSDHFPVWGEFTSREAAGGRVAGEPATTR